MSQKYFQATMHTFKTIFRSSLVSIFLLLGVFSITGKAQIIKAVFPADSVCTADTLGLRLMLTDANFASIDFTISFDENMLSFDSMSYQNPYFFNDSIQVEANGNQINIHWETDEVLMFGKGLLLKLQFKGLKEGLTTVNWVSGSFKDADGVELPADFSGGNIKIHPSGIIYSLLQINTGCLKDDKGQVAINVTDGVEPFSYLWFTAPKQTTQVGYGLKAGEIKLRITDGNGCPYDSTFFVRIIPAPEISFEVDPDTGYIHKPIITFTNTSMEGEGWLWDFGDSTANATSFNATHTYLKVNTFPVTLTANNEDGCDTSVVIDVAIKEVDLLIPNVFTPNGDGINDYFEIVENNNHEAKLEDMYVSSELIVFNRYGKKVFESNNYLNDWDGNGLSDGVYYYVLNCQGIIQQESFKGVVHIVGASN